MIYKSQFKDQNIVSNSIQFNSIQFNSIQFNSIQFNSIQYNKIGQATINYSFLFITDDQSCILDVILTYLIRYTKPVFCLISRQRSQPM